MLAKISFNRDKVLKITESTVLLEIQHYGSFTDICHIVTSKGWKIEDFKDDNLLKGKTIYAGVNGGIS